MESSRMTIRLQPGWDLAVGVPQQVVTAFNSFLVGLGVFLTPAAVLAGTLAAWRFGVDLGWAKDFFIASGLWSHWQVWLALTISLQLAAFHLKRRGVRGTAETVSTQPTMG